MRKMLAFVILAVCAMALNACYVTPVKPPIGMAFSDVTAPLDHDYNKTAVSAKKGVAMSESILGLVAWGDASTQAAAKAGQIQTIDSADYHFYNVLGVYQKFETIVYGN